MGRRGQGAHCNLVDNTTLLEEVGEDFGSADVVAGVEVDLEELAKATGVVVAKGLGIAKGLQQGIGLEDLVLNAMTSRHLGKELHCLLGGFGLPSA